MTVDKMTWLKTCVEVEKNVNEQHVVTKIDKLWASSSSEIVACLCNVCFAEKKANAIPHKRI